MARVTQLKNVEPESVVMLTASVIRQKEGITFVRFAGGTRWYVPNDILVEMTRMRIANREEERT